ncbi:hypothetical protein EHP00_2167 [Ecytonucleospora hepatopenaei]|uniref:Uncharacterized protein n=1 Tax=Ecytonucleospora hepatopenaei TaxID=646526 RepID=A0A1W0E5A0_9MICR|nr:hypothetical protein EHP00_2167 [Ecytonucleospora hepatopenaei]
MYYGTFITELRIIGINVSALRSGTVFKTIFHGFTDPSIIPKTQNSLLGCLQRWYFCLCTKRLSSISTTQSVPPSFTGFSSTCLWHGLLKKSITFIIELLEASAFRHIWFCLKLLNHLHVIFKKSTKEMVKLASNDSVRIE